MKKHEWIEISDSGRKACTRCGCVTYPISKGSIPLGLVVGDEEFEAWGSLPGDNAVTRISKNCDIMVCKITLDE